MYILKVDLPGGVVYFTGKKRIVQGVESPGLTDNPAEARQYEDKEEAAKYCKMLIRRYDMEFYMSVTEGSEQIEDPEKKVTLADFKEYNFRGRKN